MLPDHEEAFALGYAEQQPERAEVSVSDIDVPWLHRREHRLEQTALLRMTVLAADHLRHQPDLRLQHHERLARQRPSSTTSQHFEPTLRGRQVIAIERFDSIARQPRRAPHSQRIQHRTQPLRRIGDQPFARAHFNAVELRVQRSQRDRELFAHRLIGRVLVRGL
jgi:hypothetical protein